MKQIYKRQPQIHELPYGWSDMDAVKYNNINSITGLQHVDNSLAAAQNGTYNCKNVYPDESNNLTVRPALRYSGGIPADCTVLGYYTPPGDAIIHCTDGRAYFLKSRLRGTSNEIGAGNITVQEFNGSTYIMYRDKLGKLKFDKWVLGKLETFEPPVPTNNETDPISRLYNLLSPKFKYQEYDIVDAVADDKYFNTIAERIIDTENLGYARILKNGDILTVQPKSSISSDSVGYIRVWGVRDSVVTKICEIETEVTGNKDYYCTDNSDSLNTLVLVVVWQALNPRIIGTETHAIDLRNPDNTAVRKDEYTIPDTETLEHICAGPQGAIFTTTTPDNDWRLRRVYQNEMMALPRAGYTWDLYSYDTGFIALDCRSRSAVPAIIFAHNAALANDTGELQAQQTTLMVETGEPGHLAVINTGDDLVIRDLAGTNIYYGLTNLGWQKVAQYIPAESDNELDLVYTQYMTGSLGAVNLGGYYDIPGGTERSLLQLSLKTGGLQEYAISGTAIYANLDATIVLTANDGKLIYRARKTIDLYKDREVSDDFPVLSEIDDEVLTSFYLDNIHWFVTKHRVFGTGVADAKFTIEYFDPRKYFHFDEEITAAIRISDSSFWLFHNRGAYLIYKGTSEIYDILTESYVTMITWLCTSTAESKGCDFDNAVLTLPVSNYVSCVTSDDVSVVQMRENVQTDDRILVPMTLPIQRFVASLLDETSSVVTGTFKYNALYFLNPQNSRGIVPVLVYNAPGESWWYWELPLDKVIQANATETNIEILAKSGNSYAIYDFYTDYYEYKLGGLTYELYADRIVDLYEPTQIEWFWESAILHFGTVDYKKQLLYTSFTFGERDTSTISFEYNFEVYDREYSERSWSDVTQVVERSKTYSCKNVIAKFMYLQLYLKQSSADDFNAYTKPKFSAISLKYRILPGGIL